jgi:hypothetical protein
MKRIVERLGCGFTERKRQLACNDALRRHVQTITGVSFLISAPRHPWRGAFLSAWSNLRLS